MRPKFLLGLLPALAVTAFAVGPVAAAQARTPCFENTEKGACITTTETLVATSSSVTLTDTQAGSPLLGVAITCESTIEGSVKNSATKEGEGTIATKNAKFTKCTSNLPPECKVEAVQVSPWTVATDGVSTEPATYTLEVKIPTNEGEIKVTGVGCADATTLKFQGTVDGAWANDNPSTLTFNDATGLTLGTDSTILSAVYTLRRGNGTNIFLS